MTKSRSKPIETDYCPECGFVLSKKIKLRSTPQHRRYFAMIRFYYDNWPENHGEQFETPDRFRKWAQMKCGHNRVTLTMDASQCGLEPAQFEFVVNRILYHAFEHLEKEYAAVKLTGSNLSIYVPESIAYDELDHVPFCELSNDVQSFLEGEAGFPFVDYEAA